MHNRTDLDIDPRTLARLPQARSRTGARMLAAYDRLDAAIVAWLDRYGFTILRLALGLVFLWFGALKVAGKSPVEDLVADTLFWLPRDVALYGIGSLEIVIGLCLLLSIAMRVVLLLFFLQMAGTFLVLLTQPERAFQDGNPLLLTTDGEFVIKNLVLIGAGLVVGSRVRGKRGSPPEDSTLPPADPQTTLNRGNKHPR
jgi:putative oxidoreductase